MLLTPLYLTGVFLLFSFPHPLFPSHHRSFNLLITSSLLHLKMTTPFAQYVDGMMGEHPIFNQALQLVGFYLKTYLVSLTDRTFLEPYL